MIYRYQPWVTPSPTEITAHVDIYQDMLSNKNAGSEIWLWQFMIDIFTLRTYTNKCFTVPAPRHVSFQETFHNNNIADGQTLKPILIQPAKSCLPAMHFLIFCLA